MLTSLSTLGAAERHPAAGFTLVELMVTIALLGILVKLGVPAFSAWVANSKVRTVAESLQTGLRTAQTEALRRNRLVVLTFTNASPALNATATAGGKNWSIQYVPQFGQSDTDVFIGGGALSDVASGVAIASTPAGVSAVCFNSNGRLVASPSLGCSAAATSFEVTQPSSDRNLRVLVQVGGQLRMCDPKRPALSAATPDGCPTS